MDFFEAQARAKQRSARLVLLFSLAVLGTIAAGYAAAMTLLHHGGRYAAGRGEPGLADLAPIRWWDPPVFFGVAGVTLVVVGLASLFKWLQMRRGGAAVAEMLGGRPIEPQTRDLHERRLLNVVEEMAIAAGVPVPAVYVLDDEPGLNAFAAGLATHDAAVAVTRGVLQRLTRDELQGVVAHEFSHILNGDMRLNVRLTAIIFGILVIGLIGRGILYSLGRGRVRSSGRGGDKGGGVALVIVIGLALMLIGYVGYFFGRLIQAAVSRQREYLADAAAVQFTRNPGGIAGALKKIGGYALGGSLANRHAAEIGHFFFAQCFRSSFGGLWATHPPLAERIRAVEPGWDGKLFEPPEAVDITRESFQTAGFGGGTRLSPAEAAAQAFAAPAAVPPPPPARTIPFKPAAVIAGVGTLTAAHMGRAQVLVAGIPAPLREAAREPSQASVVVYGLVLPRGDPAARERQRALVAQQAGADAAGLLETLRISLERLEPAARLPLLQLCEPALRRLDPAALERFLGTLDELVHADGRVTPCEYALQKMVAHHLRLAQVPTGAAPAPGAEDFAVVLAVLARIGSRAEPDAAAAFRSGADRLGFNPPPPLPAPAASTLERLDTALDRLASADLAPRQRLLVAAAHTIGHDGQVTVEEGDLFRALAATLDCPIPPLGAPA